MHVRRTTWRNISLWSLRENIFMTPSKAINRPWNMFFFHDSRWSFTINVLKYPSFAHFLISFAGTLFQSPAFYKQQLIATCWENLDLHGRDYNLTEAGTRSVIFNFVTKATPTQVLSRKFCKIFKKTYFTEHLRAIFTSSKSFILDP